MRNNNQVNIFIVDDNRIFALALKAYIETVYDNLLLKVYSFDTGEKCMEKFMLLLPDVVVLDFSLNGTSPDAANGLQVLDQIKLKNADTSVIMLTSNNHIDTALKSFHHGASDYVIKTASQFKKIIQSISTVFSKKEMAFENQEKERRAVELLIANKGLEVQNEEKQNRAAERQFAHRELVFQKALREKQEKQLTNAIFQKSEIEKSKSLIEEKNRNITDSINYAKRIQQAQLPRKEEIYSSLPKSFVLFKPKDIVSGDFYFFHKNDNDVFIVAADCTGHGVPGAFMSMIGAEKLTDAVSQSTDTSQILKHLNKGIKNSLHQSERDDSTRDGMDIAICSIDTQNRTLKYAGANRPLWIIRNGKTEVEEIKGTKKAIGGFTDDNQHFDSHELELQKGDTFYIFSDGYADTFGGPNGKKLMSKNFKQLLVDIQAKSMQEQEIHLNDFVENWKAEKEQVDDILVIGVRL